MSPKRNLVLTSAEGQTGHLIAELLLTDDRFSSKFNSLTLLTLNPEHEFCKELGQYDKCTVVPALFGEKEKMVKAFKDVNADTVMLIPPSVTNKLEVTREMLEATKEADVGNVVLLSSAGGDLAERGKQDRLREFIDIEAEVLKSKGLEETKTGNSPCVIRAGFYAENLLLYNKQAKDKGKLPLPMGPSHKFAPVALGDIALLAAHILTGTGPHGLDNKHRGQLITMTGPMLASGDELATAASQGLGANMAYESIDEAEAKKLLDAQAEINEAEKEYLLEYYQLVREGKTNYISTHAFHDITGQHPTEVPDFFKNYAEEFKPKKRKTSK